MSNRPKPIELKLIEGNPGKRPLPDPIEKKYEGFDPPEWFDDNALDEWNRVLPELERMGVLDNLDRSLLIVYCSLYSEFVRAQAQSLQGELEMKQGAANWYSIAQKAADGMRKIAIEFGMSPASRCKLAGAKKEKEDEEWEELLSKQS